MEWSLYHNWMETEQQRPFRCTGYKWELYVDVYCTCTKKHATNIKELDILPKSAIGDQTTTQIHPQQDSFMFSLQARWDLNMSTYLTSEWNTLLNRYQQIPSTSPLPTVQQTSTANGFSGRYISRWNTSTERVTRRWARWHPPSFYKHP